MRRLSLRAQLVGLVALVVLPLVAASAYLGWRQYESHREALGDALLGASRALSSAADRELANGLAVIETLAASAPADASGLREFHALAVQAAALRRESSIVLFAPDGQMLLHTGRPWGTALPNVFEQERALSAPGPGEVPRGGAAYVRRVFETGRPVYSDLFAGQIGGSYSVAVSAPVVRGGRVIYCISIGMPARAFQPLVAGRPAVAGTGAVLFDVRGFIIARAVKPEEFVGKPAPPEVRRAISKALESVDRGRNVQGERFFRAVTRSETTGWSAGVALAEEAAFGAVWRSSRESAVLAALILVLGVGLALWMGRTLARERSLQNESRAKDEFLAALSHELRNPLAAIAYSAELLRISVPGNPVAQDAVGRVARQVEQLRRLLDDLLDATRAAHGKLKLEPRALGLRESAARVADEYLRRPGTKAAIAVSGPEVWVNADPARLHQMIDNLVENAIKYGARHVYLETAAQRGAGVLAVRDDGQGIAPELLERLFVPFVQGEQSLDRAQGGLGLGLSLVKRLAEAQGGSVEAASAGAGAGSTFTVRLPLAPVTAHDAGARASAPAPRQRVLLVEDLADARESLARLLEADGHEVASAADAARALASLRDFRPDIACVDIGLPGMDGYALARELRKILGPAVRLIALTGYGRDIDRAAAAEAGFEQHLTKPVAFAELRAALTAPRSGSPLRAGSG